MAIKDQTSLVRDLLDPDLDTAEIQRRHGVGPDDLRAIVRSPAFRAAAAAIHEVDEARTAALLPAHKARAVRRLAAIANQPAETTAQAESARRAATALIRCKPEAPGRRPPPETQEPAPPECDHGADRVERPPSSLPRNPAGPTVGDLLDALAGLNRLPGPSTGLGLHHDAHSLPASNILASAGVMLPSQTRANPAHLDARPLRSLKPPDAQRKQ